MWLPMLTTEGKSIMTYMPSHSAWRNRSSLIGQEVRHGPTWKVVKDVIVSPYRNAYAIVFADGTLLDMSSYCEYEVR